MKRVTVYETSYDYSDSCLNAVHFIKEWQDNLNLVPEEFRQDATIKFEILEGYGEHYANLKLSYERPETDKELRQKEYEEERIKAKKLAEYNKLKQELCL